MKDEIGCAPSLSKGAGIIKNDGRTRPARFRKQLRNALVAHVGGTPSMTQLALIDLAVDTALELENMKARRDNSGGLSIHDHKVFLAYGNTYRRTLVALGVKQKGGNDAPLTIADYIANKSAKP